MEERDAEDFVMRMLWDTLGYYRGLRVRAIDMITNLECWNDVWYALFEITTDVPADCAIIVADYAEEFEDGDDKVYADAEEAEKLIKKIRTDLRNAIKTTGLKGVNISIGKKVSGHVLNLDIKVKVPDPSFTNIDANKVIDAISDVCDSREYAEYAGRDKDTPVQYLKVSKQLYGTGKVKTITVTGAITIW